MSSAVFSTSAASGRPFVFDSEEVAEVCRDRGASLTGENPKLARVTPASRLEVRPAPEMASSGIAALDALTGGGLPRGCLTEICGPASSGRTTLLLAALATATLRGEFCVVVDASDSLDPQSAADAGVDLDRLLWVRCGEDSPREKLSSRRHPERSRFSGGAKDLASTEAFAAGSPISRAAREVRESTFHSARAKSNLSEHCLEQVLRATDLLLESGGFGLVALDLGDVPIEAAHRIPLTTWFRFRRAVEHKPTVLLAIEQQAIAGSCASLVLRSALSSPFSVPSEATNVQLLTGLDITLEIVRSRLGNIQRSAINSQNAYERKPAGSVSTAFTSKTAWR